MLTAVRKGELLVIALFLCVIGTCPALAQTTPKIKALGDPPKTVLYVGNSFFYFNNSMHQYVLGLSRAADPANKAAYRSTSVTISGAGLNWHDMEAYLRPGGMASYSFTEDNTVVFNRFDKPFDAVVMNDCSQCPIHPQLKGLFHEYVAKYSRIVVQRGAKPVLFMTWAYADMPEMTAQLAEQYTIAGNQNGALVIPAGLAFAKVRAAQPDLVLYAPDKRHPSLLGTYLAACTIYGALYGKSPAGIAYTGGVDPKTAGVLQGIAWETVTEYFGR